MPLLHAAIVEDTNINLRQTTQGTSSLYDIHAGSYRHGIHNRVKHMLSISVIYLTNIIYNIIYSYSYTHIIYISIYDMFVCVLLFVCKATMKKTV